MKPFFLSISPMAFRMFAVVATVFVIAWQPVWGQKPPGAPGFVSAESVAPEFDAVLSILNEQCMDCHDQATREGTLDLERFGSVADVMSDRATWKRIFDVVEGGQMPLPQSGYELQPEQRDQLLRFVRDVQSIPDPTLGVRDPGKPVLRRLTRLEYNNTVRDLFKIEYDVFMFPERLPVADKRYFTESTGSIGSFVQTSMREYGQKYDVLLPQIGLPGDNRAEHGFANRGDTLNVSPLLFEKYLELAARIASNERLLRDSVVLQKLFAVEPPPLPPAESASKTVAATNRFAANNNIGRQAEPSDTSKNSFVEQLTAAFEHGSGGVFDVPSTVANRTVAGKGGLIKVRLGGQVLTINPNEDLWLVSFATAEETSGDHLLTNRVKGQKTFELTFGFDSQADPKVQHLAVCVLSRRNQSGKVHLTAILEGGEQIRRSATIDADSGNVFFSWTAPPERAIRKLRIDGSEFSGDYVLLDDLGFILSDAVPISADREAPDVETAGPISSGGERASKKSPLVMKSLRRRIEVFLRRAYRRSVTQQELTEAVELVRRVGTTASSDTANATGVKPSDKRTGELVGLRRLVQSVLASPKFLFVAEPIQPAAGKVRRLDDFELANRLSYFLWSSMPDQSLFDLAAEGRLSDPDVMSRQVRRMLADRTRSRELSESFAAQWLRLDQLYAAKPDRKRYKRFYSGPQGKSTLHGAMMTEALLLFETVLTEDRSIVDLYDADFTWLNTQLATLYKLGPALDDAKQAARKSGTLPEAFDSKRPDRYWFRTALPDRIRGGVMTMGGPLVLTSLPLRTSPIKRGAWLLETVFNRPPAEPKVAFVLEDVAEDKDADSQSQTVREKFEQHRSDPNCYSCHIRIDPPGFSLESFDGIGAFRTEDGDNPIDASGTWNGRDFQNAAEFKDAIRTNQYELARGFVEHLLSYAIGRKIEHFDMPAIDKIVADASREDYRISSIIDGIVRSYPFQYVRNSP